MRILNKNIDRYSSGNISLIAENEEDMWLLYNLVQIGDNFCCSTMRKVQTESATGSVASKTVRTNLTIQIETIDFDTQVCDYFSCIFLCMYWYLLLNKCISARVAVPPAYTENLSSRIKIRHPKNKLRWCYVSRIFSALIGLNLIHSVLIFCPRAPYYI